MWFSWHLSKLITNFKKVWTVRKFESHFCLTICFLVNSHGHPSPPKLLLSFGSALFCYCCGEQSLAKNFDRPCENCGRKIFISHHTHKNVNCDESWMSIWFVVIYFGWVEHKYISNVYVYIEKTLLSGAGWIMLKITMNLTGTSEISISAHHHYIYQFFTHQPQKLIIWLFHGSLLIWISVIYLMKMM